MTRKYIGRIIVACLAAVSLVSGCRCGHNGPEDVRLEQVVILWSNGFNSLSSYLKEDIEDLKGGYLPYQKDNKVVLVVSHLPKTKGNYKTGTSPQLIRMYRDKKTGVAVMDTLKSYSVDTRLAEAATMKSILSEIHTQFDAKHYGMIFSSHSTGWLPKGYYADPWSYESKSAGIRPMSVESPLPEGAVPYIREQRLPGEPEVRSLGSSVVSNGSSNISYETELTDFATALPFHFDYIIFDTCLTGCVEVAYQLKDAADIICFSPAEVLAQGLDYTQLTRHLLQNEEPDVDAVAEDYYNYYANQSNATGRAATVTVIKCGSLEPLAAVCKNLFEKYRTEIGSLKPEDIQRYYRSYHHWFYDLEDILLKAGISQAEKSELQSALNGCITYKAATDSYLASFGGFQIKTYSGLSMYLPCDGSSYLDDFYKGLAWNKSTELVD